MSCASRCAAASRAATACVVRLAADRECVTVVDARTCASGERLKERSGEADAHGLLSRRDPVDAQHRAVAEDAAAADRALPAHDGVEAADAGCPSPRRRWSRTIAMSPSRELPASSMPATLPYPSTVPPMRPSRGLNACDRWLVERVEDAVAERARRSGRLRCTPFPVRRAAVARSEVVRWRKRGSDGARIGANS